MTFVVPGVCVCVCVCVCVYVVYELLGKNDAWNVTHY